MPELIEQLYCSQQIIIPPKFPYILKRYCKAAIKTQPYDLLRWSFEYFRALSLNRPPPVKLRLEYPIYNTEGGLTKGCLKAMTKQLAGMDEVPLATIRAVWRAFCLDTNELRRIFCLCEVFLREEVVPFLHFVAVAGGLLTKSLTNTMILLCETLTNEPDGGSAFIPTKDFLVMYKFLAKVDASKDVHYFNGYREGYEPAPEATVEEEEEEEPTITEASTEDYWLETDDMGYNRMSLVQDKVPRTARLSVRMTKPLLGEIERSHSVERATMIAREQYLRERKGKPMTKEEVEEKLKYFSLMRIGVLEKAGDTDEKEETIIRVVIIVTDEDGNDIPYKIYGEPSVPDEEPHPEHFEELMEETAPAEAPEVNAPEQTTAAEQEEDEAELEKERIREWVATLYEEREKRREDLAMTFDEIAAIVDRFNSASYDLGMVAGRQMSTTSGEFIVASIEKDIMAYIDEQIGILPDPDLKKKKAKPEEVAMIRQLLEEFLDENMEIIVPEIEEEEEEEEPIPEVVVVYAVPGIGPPVEYDTVVEFVNYVEEMSQLQNEVFMPRNIRHFLCPPLEDYKEEEYDERVHKAEIPKRPEHRIMI